ncbi:MAG: hypothetical protein U9Q76_05935 [candidate division WOR-3 bacterium]|nr:hypothetical protein [candidate division WOR-3 bacterium]
MNIKENILEVIGNTPMVHTPHAVAVRRRWDPEEQVHPKVAR